MQLHTKILIGLVLGAVAGAIAEMMGFGHIFVRMEAFGQAFIRLLIMIVIPLVMASLIIGTASLGDLKKLGRIGMKTIGYYLVATALAVAMGLAVAGAIQPGAGLDEEVKTQLLADYAGTNQERLESMQEPPGLQDILFNIIPRNPIAAMANMDMLQIIFFSLFFGIALTVLSEEKRKPLVNVLESVNDAMVVIVEMIMKIAPYGVFILIAAVAGRFGYQVILSLLQYVLVGVGTMVLFTITFYPITLRFFSGMNPILFFKRFYEVMVFAFSTSSSNAALPINLRITENDLGVSRDVASFVLPLGATVNMNGTGIYHGVSTIFIAQVYGISLTPGQLVIVVITATLASIGAAGVPGIGFITLAIVLEALGIPLEGLALVLGVERILDMTRTAVNVTGDSAAAVWVAKTEGELNIPQKDTY
ncbi:MAG: dicarboxylate/amino acid:cation symporter [Gemmatimonadetes bacterium]|nr:dicarboxylate/amino acid:cation symporter [Gemmatimonadota bacterium]NNM04735.1 dicarboxylate/amino acid:cation symporter [Gemmatimonadota bacterium]